MRHARIHLHPREATSRSNPCAFDTLNVSHPHQWYVTQCLSHLCLSPVPQRALLEPAKKALVRFQRSGGDVSHLLKAIVHSTTGMESTSLSDDARRLAGSIAMVANYIYWSKVRHFLWHPTTRW